MNKFKSEFKELIEEGLSDYAFFKLKGYLAFNFADVTDGFDEDMDEEYLEKLREYIDYLEGAYKVQKHIFNSSTKELLDLFNFDNLATQELILDAVDGTDSYFNELFMIPLSNGDYGYKKTDEESKEDMDKLSKFLDSCKLVNGIGSTFSKKYTLEQIASNLNILVLKS